MPDSFISQPTKWLLPTILIASVIFLALVVILPRLVGQKQPGDQALDRTAGGKSSSVKKTEVPAARLPDKFPANIPLEVGATVVQNYNATTPDGVLQATRVLETDRSLEDNFKLYKNFLSKNGWTIKASLNEDKLKVLSANKGNQQLQVTIAENTVTKVKTVSISMTQQSSS